MNNDYGWDDDTFAPPLFKITTFTESGEASVTMDSAKLCHETVARLLANPEVKSIRVENLQIAHSEIGAALDADVPHELSALDAFILSAAADCVEAR